MKKANIILYAIIIICSIPTLISSQNDITPTDSLNIPKNSIDPIVNNISTFISKKTDDLVGSIFGKSRELSNADSIINRFDAMPSFGIYKDNYIISGTNLFQTPTVNNSDAKFQVSIRHRLTNSTLPLKTYLFLTYTQKAFWNVFEESFPFNDLNYNPTIGIGKALIRHNRFLGVLSLQAEHESNGKDGEDSRSWNKISLSSYLAINDNWTYYGNIWIPFVDGTNNRDLAKYTGWGMFGLEYSSHKKKYTAGCFITKRSTSNLSANVVLNFSIRLFSDDNQYLFLQYYNGYGESMLNYKEHRSRLRLGIIIKPDFISSY